MEQKRTMTSDVFPTAKRSKLNENDLSVVEFKFADPTPNDELLDFIGQGGNYKTLGFWEHSLVGFIGEKIQFRPGVNDDTNQVVYLFRRENKTQEPSIIQMERRYFAQYKEWIEQILQQLKTTPTSELIPFMARHKEFAVPKKINDDKEFGPDVFQNELTLKLDKFRVRPYFNAARKVTAFLINEERATRKNANWLGPVIGLTIREMTNAFNAMLKFETQF